MLNSWLDCSRISRRQLKLKGSMIEEHSVVVIRMPQDFNREGLGRWVQPLALEPRKQLSYNVLTR